MTHQDAEEFGYPPNEPHDPQGKPTMKVFRIKTISNFIEEIDVQAESQEEAEKLVLLGQYKSIDETYEDQEIVEVKIIQESDNER